MKRSILLVCLALLVHVGYSQIDSIIYGLNGNSSPIIQLAKINSVTGVITIISTNEYPYSNFHTNKGRTIDPIHRIYYQPKDSVLLAFNLSTGNLTTTPITQLPNSSFNSVNFYCPDSTLYGISIDTTTGEDRLAWLDPISGFVHAISSVPIPNSINYLYGNAIDPYTHTFYYITSNHRIMGINLSDGNVVTNTSIVISSGTFGPIVFDCQDSTIYGLAGDMTNGRKLAKINPLTGIITYISSHNIADTIYSYMPTIDPFKGLYYFETSAYKLVGLNVNTGEVSTDPTIQFLAGTNFYNFIYNHSCFVSNPVGVAPLVNEIQSLELYPNPSENILNVKFNTNSSGTIEVFSTLGVQCLTTSFIHQNTLQLNISGLKTGLYFLRITQMDKTKTYSFVKS